MSNWIWIMIAATIVIDAVVITLVLRQRMKRAGFDFSRIAELTKLTHESVREHMRANYSGNVRDLPAALEGLLPVVEGMTRTSGHSLDEDTLRILVVTSVTAHKIAPRADVERAMEQVPRRQRLDQAA